MTSISPHISSSFRLGALELPNRLAQAPMAGISTRAFRLQARRHGAGLCCTEMVSSYGLHYNNRRTAAMLELTPAEQPVAVQLFGNHPDIMAEAAAAAGAAGAAVVDINMGCPVRKVVKTGAGVALMDEPELAERIVAAAVATASRPVTVKIRSGTRSQSADSFAKRMAAAGAAAVCIHPRLAVQGRKGKADHEVTAGLAAALEVPVIASGDIDSAASAAAVMGRTGCAAVMVGRACLGNPWLFGDILAGEGSGGRPLGETLAEMEHFYHDLEGEMGEERAVRFMRKFYGWYLARFRPGEALRDGLRRADGFAEALGLISAWAGARDEGSDAVPE